MKQVFVVGSLNMDLVGGSPRFVEPGETLLGGKFGQFPGGKGGNQAVALARLGASPILVGAVGDDAFGRAYRQILAQEGISDRYLVVKPGATTGVAMIEVTSTGENRILVLPGANSLLTAEDAAPALEQLVPGDLVLCRLDVALVTVELVAADVRRRGGKVILDPAPATRLHPGLLTQIDFVTPNETEARTLSGLVAPPQDGPLDLRPARWLRTQGIPVVIQKAGRQGACLLEGETEKHFPALPVHAIDTTAAGDSFNAGLAYLLAQDRSIEEAVAFANGVAALSTTSRGAQAGMPKAEAVWRLLGSNG